MAIGDLTTSKSWTETLVELRDEFRKWGVESWLPPTVKESRLQGSVTVDFEFNGRWNKVTCNRWTPFERGWLERNLRAIFLAVHSTRLADQRGIGGLLHQVAKATIALEPGKTAYEILQVNGGASRELMRSAYLQRVKETHPDVGGDAEEFKSVNRAGEELGVA